MRILFMGTPEFAVPSLDILRKKHDLVGLFTKVDKPNTRGKKVKYTPLREYGIENNIPVHFNLYKLLINNTTKSTVNNKDQKPIPPINPILPIIITIAAKIKIIPFNTF